MTLIKCQLITFSVHFSAYCIFLYHNLSVGILCCFSDFFNPLCKPVVLLYVPLRFIYSVIGLGSSGPLVASFIEIVCRLAFLGDPLGQFFVILCKPRSVHSSVVWSASTVPSSSYFSNTPVFE